MADMRQIFTYPTNSGTNYIDPLYVGNATSGLTRRVDELLAGTYRAWSNLDPVSDLGTTSAEAMTNLSKFINYEVAEKSGTNLTFYDFWTQPIVVGTKKLIDSENVTATATSPMVVTTSNTHEFENGMKISTTNINGTWGDQINAGAYADMYTKVINNTTLQIATDSALTNIIGFIPNGPITLSPEALNINVASGLSVGISSFAINLSELGANALADGTAMTINSTVPANAALAGTYYLKNLAGVGEYSLWNEVGLTTQSETNSLAPLAGGITATATSLTNPGLITTSSPLAAYQLKVYINPNIASPLTFSEGAYFTNMNNLSVVSPTGTITDLGITLTPTGNTNEYSTGLDWTNTVTTANSLVVSVGVGEQDNSNTAEFFGSNTVARIAYDGQPGSQAQGVGGTAAWTSTAKATIVDGDAVTFPYNLGAPTANNYWNYFPNSPYYLKTSVLPSGHPLQGIVWDIYKDAALTQPYNPTVDTPANFPAQNMTPNLVWDDRPSYTMDNTNNNATAKIKATTALPDWGIAVGDVFTNVYDATFDRWNFDSKPSVAVSLNGSGAPAVAFGDQGTGPLDNVPRFYIENTITGLRNATGTPRITVTASTGNIAPGTFTIEPVDPTSTATWKLYKGGEFLVPANAVLKVDCVPVKGTSNPPQITTSRALTDQERTCHLGGFWSKNMVGAVAGVQYADAAGEWEGQVGPYLYEPICVNQIDPTQPGYMVCNYQTAGGSGSNDPKNQPVFLKPTGNPLVYDLYQESSFTTPSTYWFNNSDRSLPANNEQQPPSTVYNYNQLGAIVSNTNLQWNIGDIDWSETGTNIIKALALRNDVTGNFSYYNNLYTKRISSSAGNNIIELYTDAALTTPILSADFILLPGYFNDPTAPIPPLGTGSYAKWEVIEALEMTPDTPQTLIPHIAGEITATRYTNSTDNDFANNFYYQSQLLKGTGPQYYGTTTQTNKLIDDSNLIVTPLNFDSSNVTVNYAVTDTTTGQIAPASDEPYPYELDTVEIVLPGNKVYSYQDTNNATVYEANVDTSKYWIAGGGSATLASTGETSAQFTTTVDASGYLNSVTLVEEPDAEGRYADGNNILFPIIAPANTYVPPTPTPAELEDEWDTDDEWASDSATTPNKEWPHHVTPISAEINYHSPTIVNNSQSGIKYTRSSGHTKWTLDVVYPPMGKSDFQKFHAIAQAAHGQSTPFYFVLDSSINTGILWKEFTSTSSTNTLRFKNAIVPGDTLPLFEGFASNENAFIQGEVFIDGENENGELHTSLSATDSNIFGEAKIRTPWPFRTAQLAGDLAYKNPYHAIVTLGSDNFEYSVDNAGYYYVGVTFDLDSWK